MGRSIAVIEPEFNAEGYPTDATLECIVSWKIDDYEDCATLLAFVQKAWHWPSYFTKAPNRHRPWPGARTLERRYTVSTGGWSGNESLIAAMESNFMFWTLTWESSRRGGHYIFEVAE